MAPPAAHGTGDSGEWKIAREVEAHLNPQRKLIAELMHSDALRDGDIGRALQQVTEIAARALRVDRASVWLLSGDAAGPQLSCADLFERAKNRHSAGLTIPDSAARR